MSAETIQCDTASGQSEVPLHWALLGLSTAVLIAALVLETRGSRQVVLPLLDVPLPESCTFHRTTGFDCPGCGLTRSFIAIAHARWAQAWQFNPAGYVLFALVVLQVPYRAVQLRRIGRGIEPIRIRRADWIVIGTVPLLIGQWMLRLAGIL